MSRLGNANKRAKVIQALVRSGLHARQGKKHVAMVNDDGNLVTTIPNARDLNVRTLEAILKQCGLTEDQYLNLY